MDIIHIIYHIPGRLIDESLEGRNIIIYIPIVIKMIELYIGDDGDEWKILEK